MVLTSFHWRLFKRLLILLPVYSLIRFFFYLSHEDLYSSFTYSQILYSFILGLRFDIAALCLLNSPLLILSFFPLLNKKFLIFERVLFVLLNGAGVITSINDYELYNFTGKRLSLDFFLIADDILMQLPQVMLYYWHYTVFGFLLLYLIYYLDQKFFILKKHSFSFLRFVIVPLFLSGLFFVGIRGGLQRKSINVQSAFVQGSNELGQLVLNTPYHFIRTLKSLRVAKPDFLDNNLVPQLLPAAVADYQGDKNRNVVLIILESFSLEYMDQGYTPFLSDLAQQGLFFSKHLANGRKSIESLPSLLCSIPSLLNEPFSKSIFQSNKVTCFPDLLKTHGYTNYFFHAGGRGTMGFDEFTRSHSFDKYFALEDYPDRSDFDGTWGIFDGPYLQYVVNEISKMPSPFLAGIFTLSSHHPYAIPAKFKDNFNKGTLEIHESIGYADWALKEFFDHAKTQEWYDNTLFIITADHTSKLETQSYQNLLGHYRVPLLFFAPNHEFSLKGDFVTQHSDIPHSILDFLMIDAKNLSLMGRSVFSNNPRGAFNYIGGNRYVLAQDNQFITLFTDGSLQQQSYDWDTGDIGEYISSSDLLLRVHMQYFFNSLFANSFEVK